MTVGILASFIASRPRSDFDGQYQKLSSPKLILFLDHAGQIPVEPVSRLHGVSLTWVYYDPSEEKSDYRRARRLIRIHPNASVQFRSDRKDSELLLLRTDIAKLWGPRIEKDRRGETHYIFVTDALYQQDKDWHDHPQKLFTRYLRAWVPVTLLGFVVLGLIFAVFSPLVAAKPLPSPLEAFAESGPQPVLAPGAPRRRSRLTSRSFLLRKAARRARRRQKAL
jgi:hypothetical protein